MKYLTVCFYVLILIFNSIAYGLIIDIPGMKILEIIFIIGNFFFIVYWIIILWKSQKFESNAKIGYTIGLIFIPFVFAPLLAFQINKNPSS